MDTDDRDDGFGGGFEQDSDTEEDQPTDRPPPPPPDWAERVESGREQPPPQQPSSQRPPPPQQPPSGPTYGGGSGPPSGSGQKKSRRPLTIIAILLVIVLVALVGVWGLVYLVNAVTGTQAGGISVGGERVGLITISGIIHAGGRGSMLFGESPGSRAIMSQIRQAAKDDSVRAVLLRINSPGGSAAASSAIYKEIVALSEKKPVVASLGDVAASGGYYLACGADEIVADGSTMTASIGVIMSTMGYYGLMEKLGLSNETIKAGKFKDMGSPMRPMKLEERQLWQEMLDDVHRQFVEAVVKGRDMPEEKIRKYADGRVMTGNQARKVGLVDRLGNFHDAVRLAGEKGGIKGEPKLKTFGPPRTLLDQLLGTESLFPTPKDNSIRALHGPLLIEPGCYTQLLLDGMLSRTVIND